MTTVNGCKGNVMKKIFIMFLALVAVFCTFAGCNDAVKEDNTGNTTNVTDNTDKNTDNTGNGENTGDDNGNGNGGSGKVVSPITGGGSFTVDGDYS